MVDQGKHSVLGVSVDAVDYEAAMDRLMTAAEDGRRCTCSALAVHGIMTGALDRQHRYRLNQLDLVVPDGQPVRWALRLLHGARLPDRVYGPELTLRASAAAAERGVPVYFYGSTASTLEHLTQALRSRFPALEIAGAEPSRFRPLSAEERVDTIRRIRDSGARMTFVGLGCPRQEIWTHSLGDGLAMPVLAVGAAFDFHAGLLRQAPSWMQRLGLEWFFRLAAEPKRLWRRYLYLNPAFVAMVAGQKLGLHTPGETVPPSMDAIVPG